MSARNRIKVIIFPDFSQSPCYLCTSLRVEVSLLHAWLLPCTNSFASIVSCVFGLLTTRLKSGANDFLNAKSHARDKKLLITKYLRTVMVYAFSGFNCTQHALFLLSTVLGFYITLLQERDYNAVPFERPVISQSLCNCDRSLSQESIRKLDILHPSFRSGTDHTHIFCSSWSRGISEKFCKEICIACSKSAF